MLIIIEYTDDTDRHHVEPFERLECDKGDRPKHLINGNIVHATEWLRIYQRLEAAWLDSDNKFVFLKAY